MTLKFHDDHFTRIWNQTLKGCQLQHSIWEV